jgi:predicted nucleic-acid-binding protein
VIGVDTNVLLRLFVEDDPRQNALAASFFDQRHPSDPAYLSIIVIAEFVWVLESKFKYPRVKSMSAVEALLGVSDVIIEQPELVRWAVAHAGSPKVDFSDALVSEASRIAGASRTMTFDFEAAKRIPGMELLK